MKDITLQPWARVEGTVTIDGKPGVKETVKVDYDDLQTRLGEPLTCTTGGRRIIRYFEAQTDAAGHFALDRVPPGKATISRYVELSQDGPMSSGVSVNGRSIDLVAGQTLTVNLSGLARQAEIRERAEAAKKSHPLYYPPPGRSGFPQDSERDDLVQQENRSEAALKVLEAKPRASQEERMEAAWRLFATTAWAAWATASVAGKRSAN